MNDLHMLNAMQQMLLYTLGAVCIITLPVLFVGLFVSVIQAATQINEMTMTFIPKMIVMFLMLFFLSPWLFGNLVEIMHHYIDNLPQYIR